MRLHSRSFGLHTALVAVASVLFFACAIIPLYISDNKELESTPAAQKQFDPGQVAVFLALSGGGTRAAALAYGAMKALEAIAVPGENGSQSTLMREVDYISSVSGGSFVAAYYTYTADGPAKGRFDEIKERALYRNIELAILIRLIANPLNWFRLPFTYYDRTNQAADLYDDTIFDGKRFADLPARPKLILNATDLVTGVRFEFSDETFRCLKSDLAQYPLGNAVAASSALPGAFSAITLSNFGPEARECLTQRDQQSLTERTRLVNPFRHGRAERRLRYLDRVNTHYVHLSDGGITDNLGLDAFLDLFEGDGAIGQRINQRKIKAVALISVNATPAAPVNLGRGGRSPTTFDVVMRAFDLYLEDAGHETLGDVTSSQRAKARFIKDTNRETRLFFIDVKFDDIPDPKLRGELSAIGTRLSLPDDQVTKLIEAGKQLIHTGRGGQNQAEINGLVEVFRTVGGP